MKSLDYDCQACGLCCVADGFMDQTYVALGKGSFDALSSYYKKKRVIHDSTGFPYLGTKQSKVIKGELAGVEATVCIALQGDIGHRVRCSIYGRRPSVCRAFRPGGRECKSCWAENIDVPLSRTGTDEGSSHG